MDFREDFYTSNIPQRPIFTTDVFGEKWNSSEASVSAEGFRTVNGRSHQQCLHSDRNQSQVKRYHEPGVRLPRDKSVSRGNPFNSSYKNVPRRQISENRKSPRHDITGISSTSSTFSSNDDYQPRNYRNGAPRDGYEFSSVDSSGPRIKGPSQGRGKSRDRHRKTRMQRMGRSSRRDSHRNISPDRISARSSSLDSSVIFEKYNRKNAESRSKFREKPERKVERPLSRKNKRNSSRTPIRGHSSVSVSSESTIRKSSTRGHSQKKRHQRPSSSSSSNTSVPVVRKSSKRRNSRKKRQESPYSSSSSSSSAPVVRRSSKRRQSRKKHHHNTSSSSSGTFVPVVRKSSKRRHSTKNRKRSPSTISSSSFSSVTETNLRGIPPSNNGKYYEAKALGVGNRGKKDENLGKILITIAAKKE